MSINSFLNCRNSIADAKYLTNKGVLLRNQPLRLESRTFAVNGNLYVYYIDEMKRINKLKIRNSINLLGKSKVDLLIDIKDPKRYYIDDHIKSNKENSFKFKDKIFPNYISYYEDNNNYRNNIMFQLFAVIILVIVNIFLVTEVPLRSLLTALAVVFMIEVGSNFKKIIVNKKIIKKIIYLSDKGTFYNNLSYSVENTKGDSIARVKVKHKDKELISDRIKYYPDKKRIDLLIDEKKNIYYIDYDICSYNDYYKL